MSTLPPPTGPICRLCCFPCFLVLVVIPDPLFSLLGPVFLYFFV